MGIPGGMSICGGLPPSPGGRGGMNPGGIGGGVNPNGGAGGIIRGGAGMGGKLLMFGLPSCTHENGNR